MKEIKVAAALFDYDGTLVDSMGVWTHIDAEFLRRRNIVLTKEQERAYLRAMMSLKIQRAAEYTVEFLDLNENPQQIIKEWCDMAREEYGTRIKLKHGVRQYLQQVHNAGIPMALVTSLSEELLKLSLALNKIGDYFGVLTLSEQEAHGKDSPLIYQDTAARLGVEACQCIMFDDLPAALIAARAAGMMTCGVLDTASDLIFGDNDKIADYSFRDFIDAPRLIFLK